MDIALTIPDLAQVLERLASLPTPQAVLALRPSSALQKHIEGLLQKDQNVGLSAEEQQSWAQYQFVEHLVRVTKAHAAWKLKSL